MQVTIGRWVHYRLSAADVERIDAETPRNALGHARNPVSEGQVFPALTTAVFGDGTSVNLVVQLDGTAQYWATSRPEGDAPGMWAWPARV